MEKIKSATPGTGTQRIVVFDLLGNSCFWCVDFDGTLQRLVKTKSGYHVEGPVGVLDDAAFTRTVESLLPLINLDLDGTKIIIPPLPRYLTLPCCPDPAHCTNMADDRYKETTLSKLEHLRGVLKRILNRAGVKNFWVLDTTSALKGSSTDGESLTEKVESIRQSLGLDGVHLSATGYSRLHKAIKESVEKIRIRDSGTGSRTNGTGYYWRGFLSPSGSAERQLKPTGAASGPVGGAKRHGFDRRRLHPYQKK
ncbi:MAG: hypothetical protein FJ333_10215 [Sphingomonadales bacterium]|nr:hypothetical protein [Sphingomonadales bacterium]